MQEQKMKKFNFNFNYVKSKKLYYIAEAFTNGYIDGIREKKYNLSNAEEIEKNFFCTHLKTGKIPYYAREFYEDFYTISYYQARGLCLVAEPTLQWAYEYLGKYERDFK